MLTLYLCLLAVLSSSFAVPNKLPQAGGLNDEPEIKKHSYGIVGGDVVNITDYPYTIAVYSQYIDRLVGGGAILNQYWVVCSAYELMGFDNLTLIVRAGSVNAYAGGQTVNISKLIMHEKFDVDYPYDIALIKTAIPIKMGTEAKAVILAKSKPADKSAAQVTGYGRTWDSFQVLMTLKAASVQVMSQSECQKHHSRLDTAFCADSEHVGPCSSDIGAPLVYKNQLIGLYIGGDTCNYHGVPDLYTDVSALRQWIEDTIKKNSNEEEMEGLFSATNGDVSS